MATHPPDIGGLRCRSSRTLNDKLIGVAVGLAAVGGLDSLVDNRPVLRAPVTIMLTASGILIAFVAGVVGIAQASAKGGGAGTGVTVSPSGR